MNGGASANASRRRERPSACCRAVRAAAIVLYGFLVAVGALFYPASVVVGAATGFGGYWIVVSLLRQVGDDFPQLPHPALAAAVAGGLPASLASSSVTGTWGALAVGLLVIEAAVLFAHWIGSDSPAPPQRGGPHDADGGDGHEAIDEDLMRQVLTATPTELLLDEWEATRSRLTAGAGDPLEAVRLRDLLIEELRSRDPVGTARWLREGPADLPDLHIRPDPGLGS